MRVLFRLCPGKGTCSLFKEVPGCWVVSSLEQKLPPCSWPWPTRSQLPGLLQGGSFPLLFIDMLWKESACKQLECMNNLIKIIKVIACEKSSKTNYYRVAMWEDETCRHSLGLSCSIWHGKTQTVLPASSEEVVPPFQPRFKLSCFSSQCLASFWQEPYVSDPPMLLTPHCSV